VLGQAGDRGAVEEIEVVVEAPGEAARRLGDGQGQVHLGGHLRVRPQSGQGQAGQAEVLPARVLEHEEDLEQRRARQVALGLDLLHHLLERHLLVRKGGDDGLPGAGQQVAERGSAGAVDPQHQGVDEEPDQIFERRPRPAGHRGADRDVVLPRVPLEQGGKGGQQGHEEGRPPSTP
jgi:hypothetical protein